VYTKDGTEFHDANLVWNLIQQHLEWVTRSSSFKV
jgi:hypothetical protein